MEDIKLNSFNILKIRSYYTFTVRVFAHVLAWLLFIFFMYFGYVHNVNMPSVVALFLSIRICLCSLITFYLFFYLIFPAIIRINRYFLLLVTVPFIFITWLSINKICYSVALSLGLDLEPLYHYLGKSPAPSFAELFTFKYLLLNVPSVVFAVSPFFFAKIVSQLTQNYAQIINSEKEKTALKIEKIEMEKQFLLAQLNPHFLFNTLNNIYGMILKNDARAGGIVMSLSKIMKYTLYENNLDKVPLEKEISFLEEYFNLNKARYSLTTDLQLIKEIDQSLTGLYIAPLITFVFIENSFKYGLKNKENKFLKIHIKIENNFFVFSIENDHENLFQQQSNPSSSGLGLQNVKQRLNLIYPNNHTLEITNNLPMFKVFLSINLN